MRKCTCCGEIKSLEDEFDKSGPLKKDGTPCRRSECRDCKHAKDAERRAAKTAARTAKVCSVCGIFKEAVSFSEDRQQCTSCRNKAAERRGREHAELEPEVWQFCTGCLCSHPLTDFDEGLQICRNKRASGARSDATPKRLAFHRALQRERRYYEDYRARKRAEDELGYLARLASRQREYYRRCSAAIVAWQKQNARTALNSAKKGAMERGIPWLISDELALDMIAAPCFYSGIFEPAIHTTGIDRIDSDAPYTDANCVPCNGFVNCMKRDMHVFDFVDACELVSRNPESLQWAEKRRVQRPRSRYNACVKRNMRCMLTFEQLCERVVLYFDVTNLPAGWDR